MSSKDQNTTKQVIDRSYKIENISELKFPVHEEYMKHCFHHVDIDVNFYFQMDRYNITLEELPDLPAQFGPAFPSNGLWVS